MAASVPSLPPSLKSLQHYLKTASEHDKRDPVVAYYCRLYTLQKAMEIDKKSPEARGFLMGMMDALEQSKKELGDHDAISSEMVGQAHMENYALKLFLYADNEDRAGRFGKNVVKSFYTAGMLMDVLTNFGEISEDIEKNRKYAKWKAAYIHNCLKNGETPHAGPLDDEEEGYDQYPELFEGAAGGGPGAMPGPSSGYPAAPPPQQPSYPPAQPPPPSASASYPPAAGPSPPAGYHQPAIPQQPPQAPPQASAAAATKWQPPPNPTGVHLSATDYQRGMKLCKYASSAMQYEDSKTAIENLTKALNLLTTGKE